MLIARRNLECVEICNCEFKVPSFFKFTLESVQ